MRYKNYLIPFVGNKPDVLIYKLMDYVMIVEPVIILTINKHALLAISLVKMLTELLIPLNVVLFATDQNHAIPVTKDIIF